MSEWLTALQRFLEAGGSVLWLIAVVSGVLAGLIIERFWYMKRDFPRSLNKEAQHWTSHIDQSSWHAKHIRQARLSQAKIRLHSTLPLIRVFVALCPLLGLLGTVTGMIGVFDIIAILGTGNAREMASGISKATIPTMAGMTVMIPGLYFYGLLKREVDRSVAMLAQRLSIG